MPSALMQDMQMTRNSDFLHGLVVDPSIISTLLKKNSSKQSQNPRKSKMRNQRLLRNQAAPQPGMWQQFPSLMNFGAVLEERRPASEASDSTREPFDNHFDSSESDSLDGSGGGSSNGLEHNDLIQFTPPPGLPPPRQRQADTMEAHLSPMPQPSKINVPLRPGLQVDPGAMRTKAATNSSPADFAAAWTQAESTGAWKREGKQHRGLGQNRAARQNRGRERKNASEAYGKDDLGVKQDCYSLVDAVETQDIPLPKFLAPAQKKAPPLPVGAIDMLAQATLATLDSPDVICESL
jgi:hypothetical protein